LRSEHFWTPIGQDHVVDGIDRAIIEQLVENARLSNVELAARINLSPSPCMRRVRALEDAGVIRGYHAEVDPAALGRAFEVAVHIELQQKDRSTVEEFERRIAAMDAVVECRRMFGVPDYIVRVAVADAAAYEAFYINELAELPGVGRVNSQFTMKLVKGDGASPA
jgi:Lrp/AsnC family leucine-responsive transcriptional regulator